MKLLICFDLHDTLVNSTKAWLKAYKKIKPQYYRQIKKDYKRKMLRKDICKKYNIDYEDLKVIYRDKLKVKKIVIKYYNLLRKEYNTCIITNASLDRAKQDLKHCNIKYNKLYTSSDGLKPDSNYISAIMKQNKSDFLILIGNQTEDELSLKNTMSYILKNDLQIIKIYVKIKNRRRI